MIISHAHRFIFLAVPKTGTHALRFALRKHLAVDDEEQVQLFVQKTLAHPDIARIKHGHVSWHEVASVLEPKIWGSYFKFAIVRNPWDRFVSYCAFMHRETGLFAADPQAAMRRVLANPAHRSRVVFRSQHEFICNDSGKPQVDYVGRYESLQASFDEVCSRIGVPSTTLERVNASRHADYRNCYDSDLKARVGDLYARDIEVFGYEF